jgi:hypothetical protein
VVLVPLLNLSFLALAVVEISLDKNFMVKKHERSSTNAFESFAGSISSFFLPRQRNISFWGLNFMLKDRIGTFFSFEAALPKKVVWQIDIRSYGWQLNIRNTIRPNVTRNFWEILTTSNVGTFLLVYYCVV